MKDIGIYLAFIGYKGIWFSAGKDQLEQAKTYLKFIVDRSTLIQSEIDIILKESIRFKSGGALLLKNLTELNARSARADYIIFDEESQANEDAYRASVSILAGSKLGLRIHISTPQKGSIFEENYDRIKIRQKKYNKQFVFKTNWDNCSWLEANRDWYNEEKKIQPAWYFRQEHECSFEVAEGAVFKRILLDTYPDWIMNDIKSQPLISGLDWNPVSGHWIVSGKWTQDLMNFVVLGEYDIGSGYVADLTEEQFWTIAKLCHHGKIMIAEKGGTNQEYVHWFESKIHKCGYPNQQLFYEEFDSKGLNKLETAIWIIQNGVTIYCDEMKYQTLAKYLTECKWKAESTEPEIEKDKITSPHALDAWFHCASKWGREVFEYEMTRFY